MQFDYFLLDGVLADQPIDGHRSGLADPVGSVRGLVFNCRVPPRVHVDDIICSGEVEAKATRLQADQEQVTLSGLEGINAYFSLFCRGSAVQVLIMDSLFVEIFPDDAEVADELAEEFAAVEKLPGPPAE